jgi:dihydroorotase
MSVEKITLEDPLDMHCHWRQGAMLNKMVPLSAKIFAGAMGMPNTNPPIFSLEDILEYKRAVEAAIHFEDNFQPYYTAYFQPNMSKEYLKAIKPHILSIKFYPKGKTHNSEYGCSPHDPGVLESLSNMEELEIPASVHGEADGFCMRREYLFGSIYEQWATMFPKLKIIMEHISDRRTLQLLVKFPNIFATVTPQHALFNLDAVLGGKLNPHMFWMPILKEPEDQEAILNAIMGINGLACVKHKLMLGTDSAPHPVDQKECACGCAGVFNASITLQLLAKPFFDSGKVEQYKMFTSGNAKEIYGITPPKKTVVLERVPSVVPDRVGVTVVPMLAGHTLEWSITEIRA